MPRPMPKLAEEFVKFTAQAKGFALGIEAARASLNNRESQEHLPIHRVELAYELVYLRIFNAWEKFLEESFLRYLCGYEGRHGCETLTPGGSFLRSLSEAKVTLYNGSHFLLWHNPQKVVARAARHFIGSRHQTVIESMQGRIQHFADIRHRIAHASAMEGFDSATMALAGRRYRGGRPGRFLRSWAAPSEHDPTRWIDVIIRDFCGLAYQIVPI